MSELPKYHLVKGYSSEGYKIFMNQVNALVEQGYKVHTFTSDYEEGEHRGTGDRRLLALMSLPSSTKYDNIEHLIDVQPNGVDAFLMDGWIVADSYSKFIRMVKKKVNK